MSRKDQGGHVETEQKPDEKESYSEEEWSEEAAGFVWSRVLRRGSVLLGILLILAGGICVFHSIRRQEESQEQVLGSYELHTEGSVRVHLLPNSLYEDAWRDAGQICASSLTDYVELGFRAELKQKNGGNMSVTGQGTASSVLTGYQVSGDSRKTVYEQSEILKEQQTAVQEQTGTDAVKFTLQIRPSAYLAQAEEAERILGGSVSKSLAVRFEGSFTISADKKMVEEPFSVCVEIPLAASGSFYEIALPQPETVSGQITETVSRIRPVRWRQAAAGVGEIFAGVFLIWFVLWMTREPDQKELWERRMRSALRKYGNLLAAAERLPEQDGKSVIRLQDMDSLLQVSEDLHCPVLYVPDENGLPEQGLFLISGEAVCYEVRICPEPAPLVESGGPDGGR